MKNKNMATETEIVTLIISEVQKHECLWNTHSLDYAKRDKLEKAWREVAQKTGKTEAHCRDKWRNVRTGFLRSIKALGSENDNDVCRLQRKRFYLYDNMKFLLLTTKTSKTYAYKRRSRQQSSSFNDQFKDTTQSAVNGTRSNIEDDNYSLLEEKPQTGTINDRTVAVNNFDEIIKQFQDNITKESSGNVSNQTPTTTMDIINESTRSISNTNVASPLNTSCYKENPVCIDIINEYNERVAKELMDFFRGNIGDILSLSKPNQRLFKRKMLDLIDSLHADQDNP